jgi:hypothetical protein
MRKEIKLSDCKEGDVIVVETNGGSVFSITAGIKSAEVYEYVPTVEKSIRIGLVPMCIHLRSLHPVKSIEYFRA